MSSDVRVERPTILNLAHGHAATKTKQHRVTFCNRETELGAQQRGLQQQQRRNRCPEETRSRRKRATSCSFQLDVKRRKPGIVLPSKFLLGGSITDPLNLEALDSEDNSPNPLRTCGPVDAVNVIIAPNINDPLNLGACSEDGEEELAKAIKEQLIAAKKKKQRKRRRRNSEPTVFPAVCDPNSRLSSSLDERDTSDVNEKQASSKKSKEEISEAKEEVIGEKANVNSGANVSVRVESDGPRSPISFTRQISCPVMPSSEDRNLSTNPPNYTRPCLAKRARHSSEDKIVSPVIPQPGAFKNVQKQRSYPHGSIQSQKQTQQAEHKIVSPVMSQPNVTKSKHKQRSYSHGSNASQKLTQLNLEPPENYNPKNAQFQFGNYNQYYGYRNPAHSGDVRLQFLQPEWFVGKKVLDIGCNIGHITLTIARDMHPANIIGLDIDKALIKIAKKNVRHYIKVEKECDLFPASMKTLYGPLHPPVDEEGYKKFPYNVKFFQANYVLENDALLETVRPEFDAVLCLSVTKWVHLNWGDRGIQRFFKRIFANLRPGGILILEPQSWQSYKKKRKLTPQIFNNYKNINLFPDKFGAYLTLEVGFEHEQKITIPTHHSRGFQRPIYIYRKGGVYSSGQSTPSVISAILSEHRVNPTALVSDIAQPDASPEKISTFAVKDLPKSNLSNLGASINSKSPNLDPSLIISTSSQSVLLTVSPASPVKLFSSDLEAKDESPSVDAKSLIVIPSLDLKENNVPSDDLKLRENPTIDSENSDIQSTDLPTTVLDSPLEPISDSKEQNENKMIDPKIPCVKSPADSRSTEKNPCMDSKLSNIDSTDTNRTSNIEVSVDSSKDTKSPNADSSGDFKLPNSNPPNFESSMNPKIAIKDSQASFSTNPSLNKPEPSELAEESAPKISEKIDQTVEISIETRKNLVDNCNISVSAAANFNDLDSSVRTESLNLNTDVGVLGLDAFRGTNIGGSVVNEKKRKTIDLNSVLDEVDVFSPPKKCKL